MKPLLDWLRNQVHKHGKLFSAVELCTTITGEKLNFSYFMDYARVKYTALYNL
jgi:carboxypeptidase Taq